MPFKAIPKKALIHEVEYKEKKESTNGWGGSGDAEVQTIKHVRFEPSSEVVKTGENEEKLIRGSLYIDAKHSEPFIIPVVDSIVVFNGNKLIVQTSEPVYATNDKPHHVEVTLI